MDPLSLLDRVGRLNTVQAFWIGRAIVVAFFSVPYLDDIVRTTTEQDVALGRVPVDTLDSAKVRVERLHGFTLLPLVPNADVAILHGGR